MGFLESIFEDSCISREPEIYLNLAPIRDLAQRKLRELALQALGSMSKHIESQAPFSNAFRKRTRNAIQSRNSEISGAIRLPAKRQRLGHLMLLMTGGREKSQERSESGDGAISTMTLLEEIAIGISNCTSNARMQHKGECIPMWEVTNFWRQADSSFKHFRASAKVVLAMDATSAKIERDFGISGLTLTPKRT